METLNRNLCWMIVITLALIVVLFLVRNAAPIELRFATWTITTRRAVLVIAAIAIGFAAEWTVGYTRKAKR